jgi:hypothetical protein
LISQYTINSDLIAEITERENQQIPAFVIFVEENYDKSHFKWVVVG